MRRYLIRSTCCVLRSHHYSLNPATCLPLHGTDSPSCGHRSNRRRGSLFVSFSLYTHTAAVVFHRRRTLLKFRFSRLRPTLPPLPLYNSLQKRFYLSFPVLLFTLRTVIIRRLLFDSDLYILKRKERENRRANIAC
ncbi:hypothetical protein PUN28_017694 [Cardiocondyla obscurior]|uniref:Uncharacterized protein n=1 Tax=Cardiocondyla obscurior TaxID=286306 RepID=A0AAW2ENF0_9HYME